jgi:putative addiction module component (TIGR02574 family)
MTLSDLPEVRALSAREKLQLIDELLVQLARDIDSLDTTGEEQRLLEDRWNRYLSNPSSALDLEGFRKRLDALRA